MLRNRACASLWIALALLAACSDGGGGGSNNGPPSALTVSPTVASSSATTEDFFAYALVSLSVTDPPVETLWIALDHTTVAISSVDSTWTSPTTAEVWISFQPPLLLGAGTYQDTVTVRVCTDEPCQHEIANSPIEVSASLVVTEPEPPPGPQPEEGIEPLPIVDQHGLGHDVVDAEYSSALDAIVMVSHRPIDALYLYDSATGAEQQLALDEWPSSVSVGPDGLTAAVGHDASLVTIVDLTRLSDLIVSPKTLLPVDTEVFDVVLASNGYVYAFPRRDPAASIHSVQIETQTETLSTGFSIFARTVAKLHTSGTRMYGVYSNISPNNIGRYEIANGTASYDYYRSPLRATYAMCQNLWMGEDGAHLYTACGNTFHASDDHNQDMVYAGALSIPDDPRYHFTEIMSLSHSTERGEVVLLDRTTHDICRFPGEFDCYTHLATYESRYLNLIGRWSLAPVSVDGQDYAQRGQFVFHSSDGAKRFLISRLDAMADPALEYQIGEVEVDGNVAPDPDPDPPTPTLNDSTEPGIVAAPLSDLEALPHDVVDAEFSAALDAIVMVSSHPLNALWVRDVASGAEYSIPLVKPPTSVSVGPDGLHAAVGHDVLVTHLTLSPTNPEPVLLDARFPVVDVVLAGNGYVYAIPGVDSERIHSIHIETNVDTESNVSISRGNRARLHPSGDRMYSTGSGVSPSHIQRYSIGAGTAQLAYAAPYHSEHEPCDDLWIGEDGLHIYTACGNVFHASDAQPEDLIFAGVLPLSTQPFGFYGIVSASQSEESKEIALIEHYEVDCTPTGEPERCTSHVNLYDSDSLTLTARYSLSPLTVGDSTYRQHGMFVFDTADGTARYVISRLRDMSNPNAGYYVSRLQ